MTDVTVSETAPPAPRATLAECGVVCLRGLLGPADLELIVSEIEEYIAREVSTLHPGMVSWEPARPDTIRNLYWLNARSEFFASLGEDPRLLGAVADAVEWDPVPHYVEYFAKPSQIGAPLAVHQDEPSVFLDPPEFVTLWLALDRAHAGNGGVHFYPGSHKLGLLVHGYDKDSALTVADTDLLRGWDPICFDLAPGDASIHLGKTVHFSAPNPSQTQRKGIGIAYRSRRAVLDEAAARQHFGFFWLDERR